MKSLCIIPAKGKSTRLPNKNILEVSGHPLLGIAISKAKASKLFDTVYVSTEDEKVSEVAMKYGVEVDELRPEFLAKDPSTIVDVIIYTIEKFKKQEQFFDIITVILPTSPLLKVNTIKDSHSLYLKSGCDSLLSVCKTEFPPFNAWLIENNSLSPCFADSKYKATKSTECPTTYRSNGCILICKVDQLLKDGHYNKKSIFPYIMNQEESLDIDTQFEYNIAKSLIESDLHPLERNIL